MILLFVFPSKFLMQLFIPLMGSEDNAAELRSGYFESSADGLFVFFKDIVAKEDIPVSFDFHFTYELANDKCFLFLKKMFVGPRRRIGNAVGSANVLDLHRRTHLPNILNGHELRYSTNEAREPRGLADVSLADLLKGFYQRILTQILCYRMISNYLIDDLENAVAVPKNQLFFGDGVSLRDSPNQFNQFPIVIHVRRFHFAAAGGFAKDLRLKERRCVMVYRQR